MSRCREVFPEHPATRPYITAGQVREVICPRCKAHPGEPCDRKRKKGKSHLERLYMAQGHTYDCLPFLMDGGRARRHVDVSSEPPLAWLMLS